MKRLVEAAVTEIEAEAGYSYDRAVLESAIEAGLVDGDKIDLGVMGDNHMVASVADGTVTITHGSKSTRISVSELSTAQHDRMLINKGIQASRKGHSIGQTIC